MKMAAPDYQKKIPIQAQTSEKTKSGNSETGMTESKIL